MSSLRGIARTEFPLSVRKLAFKRCCATGCDREQHGYSLYCKTHYTRLRRGKPLGLIHTKCLQCGERLSANKSKYCSAPCNVRHLRGTPHTTDCVICGTKFPTRQRSKTCSDDCAVALRRSGGHIRRAKVRGLGWEIFSKAEIFERDGWVCQICCEPTDRVVHWRHPRAPSLDHIIPVKLGGPHTRANTQCSHLMCNFIKQGRPA